MKITLILVRHGQTGWNKKKRLQGSTDIPLSKEGLLQAENVAGKLQTIPIDTIFSSTLKRATQTATIIAKKHHTTVVKRKGLNERNYGEYEGKLWKDILIELEAKRLHMGDLLPEGGEPYDVFTHRVKREVQSIILQHAGRHILIVCHGGVIRTLLQEFRQIKAAGGHIGYEIPNASVFIFTIENDIYTEHVLDEITKN